MSRMSVGVETSTASNILSGNQQDNPKALLEGDVATYGTNSSLSNKSALDHLAKETATVLSEVLKNTLHHQHSLFNVTGTPSDRILAPSNATLATHYHLATTLSNVTTMSGVNLTQIANTTGGTANGTSDLSSIDWFDMPKVENFTDAFSLCCSATMIIGGLVPYIPQYLKIKKSGSSDGFSTYVCLTLLLANILRIAFWFGHHFELPLLYQSFVMIAGMMAMMEICIRVKNRDRPYIIGARSPASRPRRSIIGKVLGDATNSNSIPYQNGSNNESTPIYSVTAGSPASSSCSSPTSRTATLLSTSDVSQTVQPQASTPYHHQQQQQQQQQQLLQTSELESERSADVNLARVESMTQYNSNSSSNSFSDLESPIMSNIQESTSSRELAASTTTGQQVDGAESQLADHSYSNGYISHQRKHRLGLVKWLSSSNFWDWDDLSSYVKFLLLFTVTLGLLTYLLLDKHLYIESLGFVAAFTESMLGIPQLVRNCSKKSTRGMSVEMVIMWLSGDLYKTLYYVLRKLPVQFIVCGSIQVSVDLLILGQVFWYRRPKVTYSKLPKST